MVDLKKTYVIVREVYGKGNNTIVKVSGSEEEAVSFFNSVADKFDKQCKDKWGAGCLTLHHLTDNVRVIPSKEYKEMDHSEIYQLQCNSYTCVDEDGNTCFIPIEDGTILKRERMNKCDMDKI